MEASGGHGYRGRLAPTTSGWLHRGHAVTFGEAWRRARAAAGVVVYREEDLDPDRCRSEYALGAREDLRWLGLDWEEGPDVGGAFGPYVQSERLERYAAALCGLAEAGLVYRSPATRREVRAAATKRSPVDGEWLFPRALRPAAGPEACGGAAERMNWRFRVPDGRVVYFTDGRLGERRYEAGRDFGDFLVWRRDGVPSYELAVVVDDVSMGITEVVRGEDLLVSTARQLLLYEALGWVAPRWYHCGLVRDPETGRRLAKTHGSLGIRALRAAGWSAEQVLAIRPD